MQPSPSPSPRRIFADILAAIPFDMELDPIPLPVAEAVPVPETESPAIEVGAGLADGFVAVLRANLQAASLHAALGHEGPSFRQCSLSACLDATNLIPCLEHVEAGVTDAELNAIFDRLLAALETGLPAAAATRTRPRAILSGRGGRDAGEDLDRLDLARTVRAAHGVEIRTRDVAAAA